MSETVLYNFTGTSGTAGGSYPTTIVQYGSTAYGIATYGGANNKGTIYSFSLNSPNTFNKLYDFSSNTVQGFAPASIIINSTGTTLYGVAAGGGATGDGAIFSLLTTPPYTYTKIFDFTYATSGSSPNQLVISGSNLYGYTISGSINGTGSLFSITTSGTGYSLLYSTQAVGGGYSNKIISLAISGTTLYFSTNYDSTSYGTIYSIPVTGGAATTLRTCAAANAVPNNLTISGSTIYFSTQTATPGSPITYANWQICSITTAGASFTQLTSLTTAANVAPLSIILSGSTLYASSNIGGANNYGALYSTPTSVSSSPTLLYSFNGQPTDGYIPFVNIFYNSTLFGVTYYGGTSNLGTIFSYGPKQYNFLPTGSTITDRYNISTNGTCQIGDNSNNLLTGTLASPPGKTNTYTLAVRGNINCVGTSTDVSGASTGTYYSNSVTSFRIAADSSANRPPQSTAGYIRYNTDLSQNNIEYYNAFNSLWQQCATTTYFQSVINKAPTIQTFLTAGTPTYIPSSGVLYIKIRMVGGGGGGGGSGTGAGQNGTTGGNSLFPLSSPLFTATGGPYTLTNGDNPPPNIAVGTATISAPYKGVTINGGIGSGPYSYNWNALQGGGQGASSAFGGGGGGAGGTAGSLVGGDGAFGGGGGGGGTNAISGCFVGAGGSAGGYLEVYYPNPSPAGIVMQVGAGGTAGPAGSGGNAGGAGGAGAIIIEEYYH